MFLLRRHSWVLCVCCLLLLCVVAPLLNVRKATATPLNLFQQPVSYNVGYTPRSLAVGLFDSDTSPDVAVIDRDIGQVNVLRGTTTGGLIAADSYSTNGTNANTIVQGDLDGDGKLDLAMIDGINNTITIGKGDGAGHFLLPFAQYIVHAQPYAMALGDLNNDGKLDLVTANEGSNDVSVLFNTGTGSFQSAVNYAVGTRPRSVTLGDLDNNGKLDIVVGNFGSDDVSVLRNKSKGHFQKDVRYSVGTGPHSVALGDFNGDHKLDLAVSDYSNTITIRFGKGGGKFKDAVSYADTSLAAGYTGSPNTITTGDVNGDGKLDLIVAIWYSSSIDVFLGNRDGTFQPAVNYAVGQNAWQVNSPVLADFNADGKPDIVVASFADSTIRVLLSLPSANGTATTTSTVASTTQTRTATPTATSSATRTSTAASTTQTRTTTPTATSSATRTQTAASTAQTQTTTSTTTAMPSTTASTMATRTRTASPTATAEGDVILTPTPITSASLFLAPASYNAGYTPRGLTLGAFDSDSTLDLAVVDRDRSQLTVLQGTSDGTFAQSTNYNIGGYAASPNAVVQADIDGDGKLDLAIAGYTSNAVLVAQGDGNGHFAIPTANNPVGSSPYALAGGDLNNDGSVDLVTANEGSNDVSVLLGSKSGFTPAVAYRVGSRPRSVALGDLNGDGKLDLAVANFGDNTIGVLLNAGSGRFNPAVLYSAGTGPHALALNDFNGDGHIDMAVANYSNTVSVRFGTGTGSFADALTNYADTPLAPGYNGSPNTLTTGDVNGDGVPDLVVGIWYSPGVDVFLGNRNGTFQSPVNYGMGANAWQINSPVLGDLNGDGKLDIAVASFADATVRILLHK